LDAESDQSVTRPAATPDGAYERGIRGSFEPLADLPGLTAEVREHHLSSGKKGGKKISRKKILKSVCPEAARNQLLEPLH
jgi:hypothetical protein